MRPRRIGFPLPDAADPKAMVGLEDTVQAAQLVVRVGLRGLSSAGRPGGSPPGAACQLGES